MAIVRRKDAVVGAQLDLRVRLRNDKTGQIQVPYEITKVQILDSDASTVLEDNIINMIALPEMWQKIVTSDTWNTAAKNVFDRWFYRMEAGGPLLQHIESTTIATGLVCSDTEEKIGYAFDNYSVPAGEWGVAGTPDDLRFHWLYGIDMVAQNGQEVTDSQLAYVVRQATNWVETRLGIDIRKRVYLTNQKTRNPNAVRGKKIKAGVDFTDHEDNYPFRPESWKQFGFVQMRHYPIISIDRAELYGITHSSLIDMLETRWITDTRIEKEAGQVYIYPQLDSFIYGPPEAGAGFSLLWLRYAQNQYPGGFEFDYTTGYETSDFMPEVLREVIMKVAAVGVLNWLGDGLLAGFSSSSISLDGLSESFSSTQSASIDGYEQITLRRKSTGEYIKTHIKRACKLKLEGFLKCEDYEVKAVNPYDITDIQWKDLKDIVEHNVSAKDCYMVTTNMGTIGITEDHSLFKAFDNKLIEFKGSDMKESDRLAVLIEGEVGSDTIIDIEKYTPDNNKMYDLSVEDFENFVVNDVYVCHNTSAFFGARLISYNSDLKEWFKHNKFKFSNVPISFA